jgi:hypothetical protein
LQTGSVASSDTPNAMGDEEVERFAIADQTDAPRSREHAWRALVLIYAGAQSVALTLVAMLVHPGGADFDLSSAMLTLITQALGIYRTAGSGAHAPATAGAAVTD